MAAKFISFEGRVDEDSDFLKFKVENGNNRDNIGDYVWFSHDGTELEINPVDMSTNEDEDGMTDWDWLRAALEPKSYQAVKGCIRRMGYEAFLP